MVKKILVIGIMILVLGTCITPSVAFDNIKKSSNPTSSGNTLYVGGTGPNNYTKIQDAINDTIHGDTVFVYNDSSPYYENIIVDKSINLVGEDKNSTIIKSSYWMAVYISTDFVNFSNFALQYSYNYYIGIYLNSNYSIIRDNIIDVYCDIGYSIYGIFLDYSNNNIICDNYISVKGYSIDWDSYTSGISFYHSNNNIITGNNISNNTMYHYTDEGHGIEVYDSNNNTIKDNTISNNNYGITFYLSHDNDISGNNIFNNTLRGITLSQSSKNSILYNNFSNNFVSGISLYGSNKVKIFFNCFLDDGIFVENSYFNNVENNVVNGKPLIYLENKSDQIITDAGQIILINCSNITVENLNLSYTTVSVELWESNNCKINNNNCSNTYNGIYIKQSNNIIAQENNLNSNTGYGIYLYNAHNIIVSNNSINGRSYGLILYESEDNIIIDNNISNNGHGIYLGGDYFLDSYSKNITISKNTICSSRYMDGGIVISRAKFINITGNIISNNNNGIYTDEFASNVVINNNIISNNSGKYRGHGVYLRGSHNISVISNEINSNELYGINLFVGSNHNVMNNSLSKNGLRCYKSIDNNVENNYVNGKPLVYMENKSNLKIKDAGQVILVHCNNITVDNLDLSNACIGIQLYRSNYCKITNNNCSDGHIGMELWESYNNTILGNWFILNDHTGISFQYTSNNNITKNIISTNNENGIEIKYSNNNSITSNNILKNGIGIYFFRNNNCRIYHNDFIRNEKNAYDDQGKNIWDDGYPSGGNYWDDYNGEDSDGDGIGDTPYPIAGGENEDRYPLMKPYKNNPPDIPTITGPGIGKPNIEYDFTFISLDPEGDAIMYVVDWGDNTNEWTEYSNSGEEIMLKHKWSKKGIYTIKAKAIDINGAESDWSDFEINIPRTRVTFVHLFYWFLERFPLLERLLSLLLL